MVAMIVGVKKGKTVSCRNNNNGYFNDWGGDAGAEDVRKKK